MSKISRSKGNSVYIMRNSGAFLHNKYVLYFILFISIINLYGLVSMGDMVTPAIFILVGFLTSFFSKNMMIVLLFGLLISNIFKLGSSLRMSEGLDDGEYKEDDEGLEDEDEEGVEDQTTEEEAVEPDTELKKKPKKKSKKTNSTEEDDNNAALSKLMNNEPMTPMSILSLLNKQTK
jgi:hypothetical protein